MALVRQAFCVQFCDYFNKFGFNDGDGAEGQVGYDYRDRAMRILNQEFKRRKMKYHAEEDNVSSMHNNCRIVVKTGLEVGKGEELEIDGQDEGMYDVQFSVNSNTTETEMEILQKKIQAVLVAAEKAFERSFKKGGKK